MLHSLDVALTWWCTHLMLRSFDVTLIWCYAHLMLRSFDVALIWCCTHLMLHSLDVTLTWCYTHLMLHSLHVTSHSCCVQAYDLAFQVARLSYTCLTPVMCRLTTLPCKRGRWVRRRTGGCKRLWPMRPTSKRVQRWVHTCAYMCVHSVCIYVCA